MKVQKFLEDKLTNCSKYSLTKEDTKKLNRLGIHRFIESKLLSKKFRKWRATEGAMNRVDIAIKKAIDNDQPLKVLYPQGGYKLWRIPSSPFIDWAEFFNISYVINYISPILESYKPGVDLIYYMHTLVPEKHDNLPTSEINSYMDSFKLLLDEFQKYAPKNLKLTISKDIDFYKSREEYFKILESNLEKGRKDYENMDKDSQKVAFEMSKLNLKLDGIDGLTKLTGAELKERIKLGAYYEKALSYLEKPKVYTKADDKVLVFSNSGSEFIGIGTTKSSMTKYWTGFGVLKEENDSFKEVILSPSQLDKVKDSVFEEKKIDLIPNLINLKNIRIYKDLPNFSRQ